MPEAPRISPKDRATLLKDLGTVVPKQRGSKEEQAIDQLMAEPEEIRNWYFTRDPLKETERILLRTSPLSTDHIEAAIQNVEENNYYYERGATLLTAMTIYPPLESMSFAERVDFLNNLRHGFLHNKTELLPKNLAYVTENQEYWIRNLDMDTILSVCIQKAKETRLTEEQLFRLQTSAEMLSLVSGSLSERRFGTDTLTRSNQLHEIIAGYAEDTNLTLETRLTCLNSLCALVANKLSIEGQTEDINDLKAESLKKLMNGISSVFQLDDIVDRNTPKNKRTALRQQLKASATKGKLHELLWFLDAQMYILLRNKPYLEIIPSVTAKDAPETGHPALNRGVDFFVINHDTNNESLVQLKSSPHTHNKTYHPAIYVEHEQGLNLDAGYLRKKFFTYRDIAEDGFPNGINIDTYFLPSVVQVLNAVDTQGRREVSDIIEEYYGLNQAPLPTIWGIAAQRKALARWSRLGQEPKRRTEKKILAKRRKDSLKKNLSEYLNEE